MVRSEILDSSLRKEGEFSIQDLNIANNGLTLSVLYGIFIVFLSIVLKVTEHITEKVQIYYSSINYSCVLFSFALMWLICFKLHSIWRQRNGKPVVIARSPHSTNRWLIGVMSLFGFAIIIKDVLEVVGVAAIDNPLCNRRPLYVSKYIMHGLFVVGQVLFVFSYSKIHIQEMQTFSRFGIMHLMATNLAVWIEVIADDTHHTLEVERQYDEDIMHNQQANLSEAIKAIKFHCTNISLILSYLPPVKHNETTDSTFMSADGLYSGNCYCHNTVCVVVAKAEKILLPLLIEFCLISSCLLYVVWSHIGKKPKKHNVAMKPSHKLDRSYKGMMLGLLVLIATITTMILLGTLASGEKSYHRTYYSEIYFLHAYESFLLSCNVPVLIASVLGLLVYYFTDKQRVDSPVGLDILLMFICLLGPLLMELFSILSLFDGSLESKAEGWMVSAAYSLSDLLTTTLQILLVIYGLGFKLQEVNDGSETRSSSLLNSQKKNNKNAIQPENEHTPATPNVYTTSKNLLPRSLNENSALALRKSTYLQNSSCGSKETIKTNNIAYEQVSNSTFNSTYVMTMRDIIHNWLSLSNRKLILKEIAMFLILCNSSYWLIFSLNGTVFKVHTYPSEYLGHSAWKTLVSITAPLTIFLKLHFAACFFEMWSYL